RIVALDDEAEAWIAQLLGAGLAGPSGLLWVRQGLMGLEPEGRSAEDNRERERGLAARRDLMSSVAGEIDMMTGGRRMDGVLDRANAALTRLATTTGKPKAGGEWARAVDEAAALAAQEQGLRAKMLQLGDGLRRRSEVMRSQAALAHPQAVVARDTAVADARAAHQSALAHVEKRQAAARDLTLADLTLDAASKDITRLDRLSERVRVAAEAQKAASDKASLAHSRAEELAAKDRSATEIAAAATGVSRGFRLRLAVAQKAQLASSARQRAGELARLLARALELQQQLQADHALGGLLKITPQAIASAEKSQNLFDRLTAQSEAQAVLLQFSYSGDARAISSARVVDDTPQRLQEATEFSLPGIGRLRIDPGIARGGDIGTSIAEATAALAKHLAACDAADLPEARRHLANAQRLDGALQQTALLLADVAPDGVDALRQAHVTALAEAGDADGPAEDAATLEVMVTAAERTEAEQVAIAKTAHALAVAAGEHRAQTEADQKSAHRTAIEAADEAGDLAILAQGLADLRAALPELAQRAAEAAALSARLKAEAPDLETAAARLARASTASDQARREADALREELASLNTRIELLAEQGIEETLDEIIGTRSAAEARAGRYETEVQALSRLRRALEDARAKARDAYFGPVMRELEPLLAILHPGAALLIDDQSLLPVALTRDGQPEALDILSGGTREQLAILTRLAFARLFARGGQTVPVILDDALVHSDDDRIEAMFTALHRVAKDQQILVLTCRQRAFAALGGERAKVVVTQA
ncbi:MAG: hypothetical protein Q8L76_10600, partial [Cypionkella sp.]|nr:hypothetical protein [Cypionkella sp.]